MGIDFQTYQWPKTFTITEIAKLLCGIDRYEHVPFNQLARVKGISSLIHDEIMTQGIKLGVMSSRVDRERQMITKDLMPRGSSSVWNITVYEKDDLYDLLLKVGLSIPDELSKEIIKRNPSTDNTRLTSKQEKDCQEWLERLMANGAKKTKTKESFKKEAKEKIGVGTKQFERAWRNAIHATGSSWGAPGRPKK
jgi:hypothetical protein